METLVPYLSAFAGFALGGGIVFLLLKSKLAEKDAAAASLATAKEMLESDKAKEGVEKKDLRKQLDQISGELVRTQTENEGLNEKLANQAESLEKSEKRLREQFENLANKVEKDRILIESDVAAISDVL